MTDGVLSREGLSGWLHQGIRHILNHRDIRWCLQRTRLLLLTLLLPWQSLAFPQRGDQQAEQLPVAKAQAQNLFVTRRLIRKKLQNVSNTLPISDPAYRSASAHVR